MLQLAVCLFVFLVLAALPRRWQALLTIFFPVLFPTPSTPNFCSRRYGKKMVGARPPGAHAAVGGVYVRADGKKQPGQPRQQGEIACRRRVTETD